MRITFGLPVVSVIMVIKEVTGCGLKIREKI